jgi:hypothetical protein
MNDFLLFLGSIFVNFDLLIGRLIIPEANFFLSIRTALAKHFLINMSDLFDFKSKVLTWL